MADGQSAFTPPTLSCSVKSSKESAPPNWTMAAFGGGKAVDFSAVIEEPSLVLSPAPSTQVTRFMAGNFKFEAANRDLISTLMLPVVHVRGNEIAVACEKPACVIRSAHDTYC